MVGSAYPLLRVSDHLDLPPQEREQERRPSSGGRGEKVWKMSHGGSGAPSKVQVGVLPVVVVPLVLLASIKRHLLLPFDPLLGTLEPLWAGSALVNPVTPQLRSYITKILLLTYLDIGTFREGSKKVVWKKLQKIIQFECSSHPFHQPREEEEEKICVLGRDPPVTD